MVFGRGEEMLKPKLHSALSVVAPVDINPCLLGDKAPQMDEASSALGLLGAPGLLGLEIVPKKTLILWGSRWRWR